MSYSCPHCEQSRAELWHGFHADCPGCQARALARSPEFADSRRAGRQTPEYRAGLAAAGLTHEQVKAAALNDFTMNGKAEQCSQ